LTAMGMTRLTVRATSSERRGCTADKMAARCRRPRPERPRGSTRTARRAPRTRWASLSSWPGRAMGMGRAMEMGQARCCGARRSLRSRCRTGKQCTRRRGRRRRRGSRRCRDAPVGAPPEGNAKEVTRRRRRVTTAASRDDSVVAHSSLPAAWSDSGVTVAARWPW